ncbi:MAG: hypothetical protein AB7V55_07180 [Oscillospiraceae bacterium]
MSRVVRMLLSLVVFALLLWAWVQFMAALCGLPLLLKASLIVLFVAADAAALIFLARKAVLPDERI